MTSIFSFLSRPARARTRGPLVGDNKCLTNNNLILSDAFGSLVVLDAGTGTCEKVLVAKKKSFSAVIDTFWHLYSETLSVWTTGFYVQVSPFGTIWRI